MLLTSSLTASVCLPHAPGPTGQLTEWPLNSLVDHENQQFEEAGRLAADRAGATEDSCSHSSLVLKHIWFQTQL